MKILCVNNTADIYGASRCLERVFGRFADAGHEVHAVLPEQGPLVELLEARGIRVHIHRGLSTLERSQFHSLAGIVRFLVLFPYSVLWLATIILQHRIDVVHTNTAVMPSSPLAALITGKRHIWHVRELLAEFDSLWKLYQVYVHTFSSTIVAISSCTRDQFAPRLRDKICVIYDGIDEMTQHVDTTRSRAFRETFPVDAQVVGVVGRIKWHRKGQEILVLAASLLRLKYPKVRYVLVGSAAPGNENHVTLLRELIRHHELEQIVTLVGDMNCPADVFAALDVAVVPSVQPEPFGCVVMEAMAVGTPVIGSRCGGITEQILDGYTGLLFRPGDASELAAALEVVLTNAPLRQSMGRAGLERAHKEFHLDATFAKMNAIFTGQARASAMHQPAANARP